MDNFNIQSGVFLKASHLTDITAEAIRNVGAFAHDVLRPTVRLGGNVSEMDQEFYKGLALSVLIYSLLTAVCMTTVLF